LAGADRGTIFYLPRKLPQTTTDDGSNQSAPTKNAPGHVRERLESYSSDEMEGILKVNYEAKLYLFSHYADDCLSMNPVMPNESSQYFHQCPLLVIHLEYLVIALLLE
jgi:hypothetical protein